jgi:hypothetical protein
MIDLYDEFRSLIEALGERGIEYALWGGMAMAVYGLTRTTIDIDLLIRSESLDAVLTVAKRLGYDIRGKDLSFAKGAIEIRRVSKIDADSGDLLSVDFLLVTSAIESMWDSREEADWPGGRLSVVSPDGLVRLKKLRGSDQDLLDIKALQSQVQKEES